MLRALSLRLLPVLGDHLLADLEAAVQLSRGKGWGAGRTTAEVAAVSQLLRNPGAALVIVDVGAHVGEWTEAAAARFPSATIHAIEPSSASHRLLAAAVGGREAVHLHQTALGAEDGIRPLWADEAGSGLASLSNRRMDHFGVTMSTAEDVPVTTLDRWAERAGVDRIDILKMDVEGHELNVLLGAERLLGTVRVLQFEFGGSNIDTRTYFQDFWYFLRRRGFELHRLGPRGLAPLHRYSEVDETFTTTNFFAVRSHGPRIIEES